MIGSAAEVIVVWRLFGSVAVGAVGVVGAYRLMAWAPHFLLLAAFGAACGGLVGRVACGRRGVLPGAVAGFILPLAYIPLWFAFDLPPDTGIDL